MAIKLARRKRWIRPSAEIGRAYLRDDLSSQTKVWIFRMLVPLGAQRSLILSDGIENDRLATALGLEIWDQDSEFDRKKVRSDLRKLYRESETAWARERPSTRRSRKVPDNKLAGQQACSGQTNLESGEEISGDGSALVLARNIRRLSELVGLSRTDIAILDFVVQTKNSESLGEVASWVNGLTLSRTCRVLSIVLDLPFNDVVASLSASGKLLQSGLLTVAQDGNNDLLTMFELLSVRFANQLHRCEADPTSLLQDIVSPSTPAELGLADFEHLNRSLVILKPYLKHVLETGRKGVNIFLYGAPGTGKNQFTKAIAAAVGGELFEIASQDETGDPVEGRQRLMAYRAAQCFFANQHALLLFDEVEDVFDDSNGISGKRSTARTAKAWINRMLETNPVPTFWLSNAAACLDPAFVRRFDMVIELSAPPRLKRMQIIQHACDGMLNDRAIQRFSDMEAITPAIIARAATVVGCIRDELVDAQAPEAIEQLVSEVLVAQGRPRLSKNTATLLPDTYDPAFIRCDADLAGIAEGLARTRAGRLCLYGPPGTGKTAYGRWLAEQLDMPLLIRKASDLVSMWVGETEKNMAQSFRQAEQDGAILLIDEVDSFLRDRRGAVRSWEVTGVNEMLAQLESYSGIFIASTNLMAGLDQAALRRFDLKVKFDYLRPSQAWQLLVRQCAALDIPAPTEGLRGRLATLSVLTPGDFAAVARQHGFRAIDSALALVCALEQECAVKEDSGKTRMGFL